MEDSAACYGREMEGPCGTGLTAFRHGGLASSAVRASVDGDPLYGTLYSPRTPEWYYFIYAYFYHDELMVNWRKDKVLQQRLFSSLVMDPAATEYVYYTGTQVFEDYCGVTRSHVEQVRSLMLKDIKKLKLKTFTQNKLGIYFSKMHAVAIHNAA